MKTLRWMALCTALSATLAMAQLLPEVSVGRNERLADFPSRHVDARHVDVWNKGNLRHSEYTPQKFLPFFPGLLRSSFVGKALAGQPRSDAYLRLLLGARP